MEQDQKRFRPRHRSAQLSQPRGRDADHPATARRPTGASHPPDEAGRDRRGGCGSGRFKENLFTGATGVLTVAGCAVCRAVAYLAGDVNPTGCTRGPLISPH